MYSPNICLNLIFIICFTTCIIGDSEYQRLACFLHNEYRARHSAKPLHSTEDLNIRAEKCANYYAQLGDIIDPEDSCPHVNSDEGENIWTEWNGRPTDTRATFRSIENWYAEESLFNYGSTSKQWGAEHFIQLVWRNTSKLGFAVARDKDMVVVVGLYWPAGNIVDEYDDNVFKPDYRGR